MVEKKLWTLKTNPLFKDLIRPLKRKEYLQLEENLLNDGCREPIAVWNGTIVDGYNRYEICRKHRIPFAIVEMDFICPEEAIAWICANQLGRRNISDETRRFLIGKQYESEKVVTRVRNPIGINQYSIRDDTNEESEKGKNKLLTHTAKRIAQENNISRGTVEKYAIYSRAVDAIAQKEPAIVPKILSGQYKIAHKNVVELSKLSPQEIRKVEQNIQKVQEPFMQYNKIRDVISSTMESFREEEPVASIKDMPAFDPDADINVLSLTIPSWTSSIKRVYTKSDLSIVSKSARKKLIAELNTLCQQIEDFLAVIEED